MINKFQQGGQMDQLQALAQFIQGIAQVAQVDPLQVMQLAQQEPERLETAVQVFQQTQDILQAAQAFFQKEVQSAKRGAKLNYLKELTGRCPEGYELRYFKVGGKTPTICSKCMAKKQKGDVIEEDKCGSKMKKKKGCGGFKVSKAQLGTIIEKLNSTKVALKQHKHGGSLNGVPFNLKGNKVPYKKAPVVGMYDEDQLYGRKPVMNRDGKNWYFNGDGNFVDGMGGFMKNPNLDMLPDTFKVMPKNPLIKGPSRFNINVPLNKMLRPLSK